MTASLQISKATPPLQLWALRAGLLLLTLLTFLPALSCGFVDYDDPSYVTQNPIMHMGWQVAVRAPVMALWHPLTTLSLWIDYQIWDGAALGFHLTNVLIHAVNVLLVFELLRRATGMPLRSALVAALWAVHPLRVESVVWVVERKDVLAALFGFLALAAYGRYRRSGRWTDYLLILPPWALSMLAKPMLMTLPILLLVLDYWPLQAYRAQAGKPPANWRRLVLEKIPLLMLALAAVKAILWMVPPQPEISEDLVPAALRWSNAPIAVCRYVWHHLACMRLAPYYPLPEAPTWWITAVAAAAILLAIFAAFQLRQRFPWVLGGLAWFLIGLLPVIGIRQVGREVALADRYSYLPGIGVIVALVFSLPAVKARRTAAVVTALVLAALVSLTVRQTSYWRNSLVYYGRTLEITGRQHYLALSGYASALHQEHRDVEARATVESALVLRPGSFATRRLLGDILVATGQYALARDELQRVTAQQPAYADGHVSLGDAWLKLNKPETARREYSLALKYDPWLGSGWGGLGDALAALNRAPEAAEAYSRSLALTPDSPHVHNNFGMLLANTGHSDMALPHFLEAIRLDPQRAIAHCNLGVALANLGRTREAIAEFEEALRLDPSEESARQDLNMLRGSPPAPH